MAARHAPGQRMSAKDQVALANRFLAGPERTEAHVIMAEKLLIAAAEPGREGGAGRYKVAAMRLWEVWHMRGKVDSPTMPAGGELLPDLDEEPPQASAAVPKKPRSRRKTQPSLGDGTFSGPLERRRKEAKQKVAPKQFPKAALLKKGWQELPPPLLLATAIRYLEGKDAAVNSNVLAIQLLENAAGRGYQPAVVKLSEVRSGTVPTRRLRKKRLKQPELIKVVVGARPSPSHSPLRTPTKPAREPEPEPEPEPEWRKEARTASGARQTPTVVPATALQEVMTKLDWLTHTMVAFDERLCQAELCLLRKGAAVRPSTAPTQRTMAL